MKTQPWSCPQCASTNTVGCEICGVYDGVLFHLCLVCDHAWPREFTDWPRMKAKAQHYVDRHNQRLKQ